MKVVLLEDVRKVGKKGDVVNVSDGYGQNFLIKNKLAVKETAGAKKILEQQKEEARLQDIENKKNAEALKEKIEGITLEFVLKSGKDGKTFGNISTKQINEKLTSLGYNIDKKMIKTDSSLNLLGSHYVKVALHKKVECNLKVTLKEE